MNRGRPGTPRLPANGALKVMRREMELLARRLAKARGSRALSIRRRMERIAIQSGKLLERISGVPYIPSLNGDQ